MFCSYFFCVELSRNINCLDVVCVFDAFFSLIRPCFCLQVEVSYCNIDYAFSYCIIVTEL